MSVDLWEERNGAANSLIRLREKNAVSECRIAADRMYTDAQCKRSVCNGGLWTHSNHSRSNIFTLYTSRKDYVYCSRCYERNRWLVVHPLSVLVFQSNFIYKLGLLMFIFSVNLLQPASTTTRNPRSPVQPITADQVGQDWGGVDLFLCQIWRKCRWKKQLQPTSASQQSERSETRLRCLKTTAAAAGQGSLISIDIDTIIETP